MTEEEKDAIDQLLTDIQENINLVSDILISVAKRIAKVEKELDKVCSYLVAIKVKNLLL